MGRGETYLGIAVILLLVVILIFAGSFSDNAGMTGRVVDEDVNETEDEDEDVNETEDEDEDVNETDDDVNETEDESNETEIDDDVNETETNETATNETTTNQTATNETVTNETTETTETTDQAQEETTTTTEGESTTQVPVTPDEEESTVQVSINASTNATTNESSNVSDEVSRIIRELEEQAALEANQTASGERGITGGVVEGEEEVECLDCKYKNKCYEINDTKKGRYCVENQTWLDRSEFNETCVADFECGSNNCVSEQCAKFDLIKEIKEFFKRIFTREREVLENETVENVS